MIPGLQQKVLLSFVVRAVLWGLTYYFIRRALNPATTDLEKFQSDAIYGSVAAFVSGIAFWYLDKVINAVDAGY
jgi:hypothetical protein